MTTVLIIVVVILALAVVARGVGYGPQHQRRGDGQLEGQGGETEKAADAAGHAGEQG